VNAFAGASSDAFPVTHPNSAASAPAASAASFLASAIR
jgi:hypothetical protein